jgi:hypothetical protein
MTSLDGWRDEQLPPWPSPCIEDDGLISDAMSRLHGPGWAVIDVTDALDATAPNAGRRVSSVLGTLGRPVRIFAGLPMWKVLRSDPSRPPGSSGGVGAQAPHLDFVNASQPPDLVALYCLRHDPAGGGASVVSCIDAAAGLSADDLRLLAQPIYRDGKVERLENVGRDINPFAVWNPEDTVRLRWTGKLLESTHEPAAAMALARLDNALRRDEIEVTLRPGQLLVVNQRRAVHGRRALGRGQERVSADRRRLLMHGFARWE